MVYQVNSHQRPISKSNTFETRLFDRLNYLAKFFIYDKLQTEHFSFTWWFRFYTMQ